MLAVVAAAPTVAHAQTADEAASTGDEIVVTAQRREELSRDVPISVTTLGSQQLSVANVNTLSDIAKLTPGLRFNNQGPASQPTIRGVGTAITTSGADPTSAPMSTGSSRPTPTFLISGCFGSARSRC